MLFVRTSNGAYVRINNLPELVGIREKIRDSGIFISGMNFIAVEFTVKSTLVSAGLYSVDSPHEILAGNKLEEIPVVRYQTRQVGVRVGSATFSIFAIEKATRETVRTRRIAWEELNLFLTS